MSGGFGFVVLEEGMRLLDWGVAKLYSSDPEELVVRLDRMFERYRPGLLVTEEVSPERRQRAHAAIQAAQKYAEEHQVRTAAVQRADVRRAFADRGRTKDAIAEAIADEFPELEMRRPSPRKFWQSQDKRMAIFEAMSFILTLST